MKKIALAILIAGSLTTAGSAFANGRIGYSPYSLGGIIGTNGIGLQATLELNKRTNLRATYNIGSFSESVKETDLTYKGDLEFNNFGAYIDWFPFGGVFRVTGGAIWNGNEINAKANATNGTINLNGNRFVVDTRDHVSLKSDWRNLAPYIGIGWGNPVGRTKGLSFSVDMGIKFTGSPSTRLTASDELMAIPAFRAALLAEESRLNSEFDVSIHPVVTMGLNYAF